MNQDIEKIAKKGSEIYEDMKDEYKDSIGKFLAIEVESREVFLGNTNTEAVEKAKKEYPDKLFYVVKIGSSVSEILAHLALDNV